MKKITLIFVLIIFCVTLNAQTPIYNVVATQPTNYDTLLMPLLGVISGPLPPPGSPLPDITPRLQDIGVTSIRNNDNYDDKLDMEAMFRCTFADTVPSWYCSPDDINNYYFDASDTLFRAIKNGGFDIYFRLGGEPQSALPNQQHVFHGPQDTVAENNLIRAMVKVVEHYDNFEGNANQLEYLNLWTEWPNVDFWERPNLDFIWFFTKALDTLKTHFPNKKIGGPGILVPTIHVMNGDTSSANLAIKLLLSLYQHHIRPDFISWHMWQMDPYSYYRAGEQYRHLLDGTGDFVSVPWAGSGFFDGVEIMCDAWGMPKMYDDGTPIPRPVLYQMHNRQKGAAMLTADWIALQQTNTKRAYYYRYADPKSFPDSTGNYIGWTGLFYGDSVGTYKPTAHAFHLWSKIYNEFPKKLSCDFPALGSDASKLWILSAKNLQGAYGFLVSNTDSFEKELTVNIDGITIDTSNYNIYYYIVNDNDNGSLEYQNYNNDFTIPLESVVFIRILPKNYSYLANEESNNKIEIYPNPTTGKLHLSNSDMLDFIEVVSTTGKTIMKIWVKNKRVFDVSKLPKGFYLLKINKSNGKVLTKRIIKY